MGYCLAAIFDSQLTSPKLSFKMPPKLPLPHKRGHFFLCQNWPHGEGNCAAIERQKLSRGKCCLAASRCLSGPSGFGAPRFSVQRSQNTYFKGFWGLWTENRGAPRTRKSTTTDPTPHSEILFVRSFGTVCSQFWESVRISVWGGQIEALLVEIREKIRHFAGWEGGGLKGHQNCEQKFCEQTGVSYLNFKVRNMPSWTPLGEKWPKKSIKMSPKPVFGT